jgi:hypothetical protein
MSDLRQAEYEALRATIRERGTMRMGAVIAGFIGWGALAALPLITNLGAGALVPLLVLFATFEVNFFVHTGVERVGRYIQVFYEEATDSRGWETVAMSYGLKHPAGGLDPLFAAVFAACAVVNFTTALATTTHPAWIAFSLIAHIVFCYRIVTARETSTAQRALDLDRFRGLISK